MQMQMDPN